MYKNCTNLNPHTSGTLTTGGRVIGISPFLVQFLVELLRVKKWPQGENNMNTDKLKS